MVLVVEADHAGFVGNVEGVAEFKRQRRNQVALGGAYSSVEVITFEQSRISRIGKKQCVKTSLIMSN